MARKTIKIEIPLRSPEKFSKMANDLKKKDDDMGANSPLNNNPNFNKTEFASKLSDGDSKRSDSEKLRQQAETVMEQARTAYGTGKGQSAETPGTVYNYVQSAKEYLLSFYRDNPEMLSQWGFDVVVGTAKSPTKKSN